MIESVLARIPSDQILILRKSYIDICDGSKQAAALLAYFEYWHTIKQAQITKSMAMFQAGETDQPLTKQHLLQFHTRDEVLDETLGLISYSKLSTARKILREKGFVSEHKNPNPRYAFDNTIYYLLHPDVVNKALEEYSKNGKSTPTPSNGGTDKTKKRRAKGSTPHPTSEKTTSKPKLTVVTNCTDEENTAKSLDVSETETENVTENAKFTVGTNCNDGQYSLYRTRTETSFIDKELPYGSTLDGQTRQAQGTADANMEQEKSSAKKRATFTPCDNDTPCDTDKPVVTENDISLFLQMWTDMGFSLPKKTTKTFASTKSTVRKFLDGSLFENTQYSAAACCYSVSDFCVALSRFKLAATDPAYFPVDKTKMAKTDLRSFLYNPYIRTNNGQGFSYFLLYKDQAPEKVPVQKTKVPLKRDPNPLLTDRIVSLYKKKVLHNPDATVSNRVYNCFITASERMQKLTEKYVLSNSNIAGILFKALEYCKMDIEKMPVRWFEADWLYEEKVNRYLTSGNCAFALITKRQQKHIVKSTTGRVSQRRKIEEERHLIEAVVDFN